MLKWEYLKQIPNFITSLRILMAVSFPFLPISDHWIIIVGALTTEFLDGFLARTFGWTSPIGKILDPVADKLFFFSVTITWLVYEKLSLVDLALLGTREICILSMIFILLVQGRAKLLRPIKAQFLSKLTTALQYVAFFSVLLLSETVYFVLVMTSVMGVFASIQYWTILTNPTWSED